MLLGPLQVRLSYIKLSTLLLDCPYSVEQIVKFALDIPTRQAEGRNTENPVCTHVHDGDSVPFKIIMDV